MKTDVKYFAFVSTTWVDRYPLVAMALSSLRDADAEGYVVIPCGSIEDGLHFIKLEFYSHSFENAQALYIPPSEFLAAIQCDEGRIRGLQPPDTALETALSLPPDDLTNTLTES